MDLGAFLVVGWSLFSSIRRECVFLMMHFTGPRAYQRDLILHLGCSLAYAPPSLAHKDAT